MLACFLIATYYVLEIFTLADNYINTGETGLDNEKKLYDCILITPDNVDDYIAPFVLEG